MEDKYEEAKIPGAKEPEPLEESKHKDKGSCICKINGKGVGTGFFCKMIYQNELVPVLITNYHVIDDKFVQSNNSLKVYINEDYKFININKNKIIYLSSNNEYDLIVIRLQDGEIDHYLKIDENIFKQNSEQAYKNEPIYILHYPGKDEKAKISYGTGIEKINEYDIKHLCNTEEGSSGSPILSATDKIIGIHKAANRKRGYNFGTFLKYPLSELNGNKNEIICIYNKQKDEIDLLHDYSEDIDDFYDDELKKSYIEGKNNINGNNIDIYINDKKIKFNHLI